MEIKKIKKDGSEFVKVDDLKEFLNQIESELANQTKYQLYHCGLSEYKNKILNSL